MNCVMINLWFHNNQGSAPVSPVLSGATKRKPGGTPDGTSRIHGFMFTRPDVTSRIHGFMFTRSDVTNRTPHVHVHQT